MADSTNHGASPGLAFSPAELVFSEDEKQQLATFISRYPTADGAVMRGLWLAQEKFGYLAPEVIHLLADTLGLAYARVYGVATFYTQYFKEKKGKFVLDVCTCYSCQLCGGYDMLHHLEDRLGIRAGETTDDGLFTIQEAECLGACGSGPVVQVTNGPYAHNLTREKLDGLLEEMRAGKMPAFESVTLPQDEDDLDGNRRSDTQQTERYSVRPVAETFD